MTVEDRDLMWGLVGKHCVTLRLDAAAAAAPTAAGPERLSQPVRELTVPLTMPWRGTGLYWNFDNSHNSQIQSRRRPAVKPQAKRRQSRCKVETDRCNFPPQFVLFALSRRAQMSPQYTTQTRQRENRDDMRCFILYSAALTYSRLKVITDTSPKQQ